MNIATQVVQPFTVHGELVTTSMILAAVQIMQQPQFTFSQVGGAIYRAGFGWDNHDRAADRLLQRCRKLNLIERARGTGGWKTNSEGWRAFNVDRDI